MSKAKRARAQAEAAQERVRVLVLAAFFLSGLAGLMHQVVWAKLLVQLLGSTASAQATVLAVFMGGLALGAVVIGRRVDRVGRPLFTYVVLEFAIAAYCALLPLLVAVAGEGYVGLATHFFDALVTKAMLRFALAFLVVLVPAAMMGGTLSALARHLIGSPEETQRQVGSLYSLNSFGAVLGAALAGFVALPHLGIHGSLAVACALNGVAGAILLGPARREALESDLSEIVAAKDRRQKKKQEAPAYSRVQYSMALIALALSGFAAMGYEVIFNRVIALSFGASAYSFSVMLMSFITGIALGSAIVARRNVENPLWLFGVSQLAVIVALLLATPLVARLPYLITLLRIALQDAAFGFAIFQLGKIALCLSILLLPTTCLGFAFPLVARIQVREPERIGGRVGSTYAWNTLGNVLGAIGTSMLLLPSLGLLGAFHFNLALNFIGGAAVIVVSAGVASASRYGAIATVVIISAIYLVAGSDWVESISHAPNHLRVRTGPTASMNATQRAQYPSTSFEAWKEFHVLRGSRLQFFAEDAHNTVVVLHNSAGLTLFVNGKADASTGAKDVDTQLLLAHAPLFMAQDVRSLLVIGHGSGITLGSALQHPIERADVVEISEGVLAADSVFAVHNHHALDDPRVRVYEEDGQSFLRTSPDHYDLIISEPSNPWMAGVSDLFTLEFFETVRDKLNPGGVFAFWTHTYSQTDESVQMVLRTLAAVFPHASIFSDADLGSLVILASQSPLEPDFAGMEKRFNAPGIQRDLAQVDMPNLGALLTHHRISGRLFPELLGTGPLNKVSRQRLEYWAPRSFFFGEDSFIVEKFYPLMNSDEDADDLLLYRYLAYRSSVGRPVSQLELESIARYAKERGGYGAKVAGNIMARARRGF